MRKKISRFFQTPARLSLTAAAKDELLVRETISVVRCIYACMPLLAYLFYMMRIEARSLFEPVGPVVWIEGFFADPQDIITLTKLFLLCTTLLAAVLYRWFIARLAVFLGFVMAQATTSSFGGLHHEMYFPVFVTGALLFVPSIFTTFEKSTHAQRRNFLLFFWFAQALCMVSYAIAGFHKIRIGIEQWWMGEISTLHVEGAAYMVADWLPRIQLDLPLGEYLIEVPMAGFLAVLGVVYLQLFAMWPLIYPSLQRIWGFGLLLFHVMNYMFLGVVFTEMTLIVILLFVYSPFAVLSYSSREQLFALPIIGQCAALGLWLWQRISSLFCNQKPVSS